MKTQTFNIALPEALVQKIDKVAKKEYRNRSEFIREAVRVYLQDGEEWEKIYRVGEAAAGKLGIKNEKDADEIVSKFRHGARAS